MLEERLNNAMKHINIHQYHTSASSSTVQPTTDASIQLQDPRNSFSHTSPTTTENSTPFLTPFSVRDHLNSAKQSVIRSASQSVIRSASQSVSQSFGKPVNYPDSDLHFSSRENLMIRPSAHKQTGALG